MWVEGSPAHPARVWQVTRRPVSSMCSLDDDQNRPSTDGHLSDPLSLQSSASEASVSGKDSGDGRTENTSGEEEEESEASEAEISLESDSESSKQGVSEEDSKETPEAAAKVLGGVWVFALAGNGGPKILGRTDSCHRMLERHQALLPPSSWRSCQSAPASACGSRPCMADTGNSHRKAPLLLASLCRGRNRRRWPSCAGKSLPPPTLRHWNGARPSWRLWGTWACPTTRWTC